MQSVSVLDADQVHDSILDWTVLSWNFGGFLKTYFEGSVDHIMYRDCKVNRRFFIHCNLASATYHSSPRLPSLRGGWIFLASEDFWRTFDDSFPACAFFSSSLKWRLCRAH